MSKLILEKKDIDFTNSTSVYSAAYKFVMPVSKMEGKPLVYPSGEKKGLPITDWTGKQIGQEGVIFMNYKDSCYQACPTDGSSIIIFNQCSYSQAETIMKYCFPSAKNIQELDKNIKFCQALGLRDTYNSTLDYAESSLIPIMTEGGMGLYRRKQDICQAVYLEGSGKFIGNAATDQIFNNGAVFVKHGDDIRMIQPTTFLATYQKEDGKMFSSFSEIEKLEI